ncbi:hypothetical protein FRB94_004001 [Tulasnella sp. JGI-2019a]|nr:hypothetical protein FRB93_003336 [Tulasnella sp. JGI-2019a]KAG9002259.1 hypothetical protein FRB94_004001 [Tulasnella sp. JGI-2019a]
MASSYSLKDLKKTKKAARIAMEANELQQKKLKEYIQKLQSSLTNIDTMVEDAEKFTGMEQELDDENDSQDLDRDKDNDAGEPEVKCIQVEGAIRTQHMTKFWTDENSPFYEDAMQKERYISFTRPRPWKASERKSLKLIVVAEQKRLYALELKASGHTDSLNAVRLNPDAFYESRDASSLEWEKISKKVSSRSAKSTALRSAIECKVQWIGWDHPQIKKGAWTPQETEDLVKIVHDLNTVPIDDEGQRDEVNEDEDEDAQPEVKVDWSKVSQQLGGSRTASQCLSRWLKSGVASATTPQIVDGQEGDEEEVQSNASDAEKSQVKQRKLKKGGAERLVTTGSGKRGWTKEEDEALLEAVRIHGRSWNAIAAFLPFSRTGMQCQHRYNHSIDPSIRRGPWTEDEDKLLTRSVQEVESSWSDSKGAKSKKWKKVAAMVPGRTNSQCRERWVNYLDPSISKKDWTSEEDKMLVALKESGSKWVEVAAALNGRTDNQCMTRYNHIMDRKSTREAAWTKEEDAELMAYKKKHPKAPWKHVAKAVGTDKTRIQCFGRWKYMHERIRGDESEEDPNLDLASEESGDYEDEISGASDSSYGAHRKTKDEAKGKGKGKARRIRRPRPRPPSEPEDNGSAQIEEEDLETKTRPNASQRPKPRPRWKPTVGSEVESVEINLKRKREDSRGDGDRVMAEPSQKSYGQAREQLGTTVGVRASLRKRAKIDYSMPFEEFDDGDQHEAMVAAARINGDMTSEHKKGKGKGKLVVVSPKRTKTIQDKMDSAEAIQSRQTKSTRRGGGVALPLMPDILGKQVTQSGQNSLQAGEDSDLTELSDE